MIVTLSFLLPLKKSISRLFMFEEDISQTDLQLSLPL